MYFMVLKELLHKKRFYLWNIVFPIVLSLIILFTAKSIEESERYKTIPVGIDPTYDQYQELYEKMKSAITLDGKPMFELISCKSEEGIKLLDAKKISGYIEAKDGLTLVILKNGITQSTIKVFLDQYMQSEKQDKNDTTISTTVQLDNETEEKNKTSNIVIYFYNIIGMCCILSAEYGIYLSERMLANQSLLAMRLNFTPQSLKSRFWEGMLAIGTISLLSVGSICCFIQFFLGYPLKLENQYVWSIIGLGVLTGVLIGYVISGILKKHHASKHTVVTIIIAISCFFSGIFRIDIKYFMNENCKNLSYLNPVKLISDAFYYLLYEPNQTQYETNLIVLGGMVAILFVVSAFMTRRRSYEHL